MNSKNKDKESGNKIIREFSPYLNLGMQLAVTVTLGALIGWYIDEQNGSSPLWTLICTFIGVIAGMVTFFKTVMNLEKKNKARRKNK